jgi:hypothetical protein
MVEIRKTCLWKTVECADCSGPDIEVFRVLRLLSSSLHRRNIGDLLGAAREGFTQEFSRRMLHRTEISQDDFDRLLDWFGPDRGASADQYLAAHCKLTVFLRYNYCNRPEDLADETMNRVAKKLPPIVEGRGHIDVLRGFARNVLKEYWDDDELQLAEEISDQVPSPTGKPSEIDEKEIRSACLDKCVAALPERELLLEYHSYEPGAKIAHRKAMAEARRLTLNALRLKACHLKRAVAECVKRCCQSGGLAQGQ